MWSLFRALYRRDAQQWPDIGMDVMLDVSVTRMATFTRVYDAVTVPLLIRVPPPRALHLQGTMWSVFHALCRRDAHSWPHDACAAGCLCHSDGDSRMRA